MSALARRLLRVALVVLLVGSVLAQLLVPVIASEEGALYPEVAGVVVPYSAAGILAIACAQVALLAVWRLLAMVNTGAVFTPASLRWVDLIAVCGALAALLCASVMAHLLGVVGVGGPGVVLGLVACLALGFAFVLLVLVMRGLLESAIADRAELDEVI